MELYELVILALGLSMDAFAVAICKGLAIGKPRAGHAVQVGLYFGIFQALMPSIGFLLGISFRERIERIDHWIAFGLLAILGVRMITEAVKSGNDECVDPSLGVGEMLTLAVATSIDALAAGISLSMVEADIISAASLIGVITFTLSAAGVYIGGFFGEKFKRPAEITGGVALVLLGIKILAEHLSVIR